MTKILKILVKLLNMIIIAKAMTKEYCDINVLIIIINGPKDP